MRLLLIRHGQSQDAVTERFQRPAAPLSRLGREQAARLAERLAAGPPPAALYCSTMGRAAETAEIVGARLGLTPRIVHDLREVGTGDWGGRPRADFLDRHEAAYRAWWRGGPPPEGFESMADCQARIVAAIEAVAAEHADGETLALVGHGTAGRLFLLHQLGLPLADMLAFAGWQNTAISVLLREAGRYRLSVYNDAAHLEPAWPAPPGPLTEPEAAPRPAPL